MLIRRAHDEFVLLETLLKLRVICCLPSMVKISGHDPYMMFI
jgi:hypothetical protein